ncbi:MAG: PASTA domain-containing protein [Acidimicrobiales bacterium]
MKGQTLEAARALLVSKGFEVVVASKSLPAGDPNDGLIVASDPAAGTQVDAGSSVTITVGKASAASTTTVSPSTTAGVTTTAP